MQCVEHEIIAKGRGEKGGEIGMWSLTSLLSSTELNQKLF